jgi:5'-methylthioadenosine phosphorylase
MCYATLAMATDYDTWHPHHDSVTVEVVVQTLNKNVQLAKDTVAQLISTISDTRECTCGHALSSAIMTSPDAVPSEVKARLRPLLEKYLI